jgi:hypothetical protein
MIFFKIFFSLLSCAFEINLMSQTLEELSKFNLSLTVTIASASNFVEFVPQF